MTHIQGLYRDREPQKLGRPGTIPCGCGCGVLIPACDDKGRPRSFVKNHQARVQNGDAWSEDRRNQFRQLWLAGKTCSQIAAAMEMPRNTVPGKASRMGLPGRASPLKEAQDLTPKQRLARERERDRKRRERRAKAQAGNVVRLESRTQPALSVHKPTKVRRVARMVVDTEPSRNILIGEVTRETCAFPTSTEIGPTHSGLLHRMCGNPVEEGRPYCAGHVSIAIHKSIIEQPAADAA